MSTAISSAQISSPLIVAAEVNQDFESILKPSPTRAAAGDGVDHRPAPPAGPATEGSRGVAAKPPADDAKAKLNEENKQALAQLNKYNALELQRMVRNGDIPDSIAENPLAMNAMLGRIQEFSRMMQMMTNMMQVEHETLMSIIRNIKA
jgi:hypothetical protein